MLYTYEYFYATEPDTVFYNAIRVYSLTTRMQFAFLEQNYTYIRYLPFHPAKNCFTMEEKGD